MPAGSFGRLAAFRHPIPELFAFAGLTFLLDESFEIYGGNVKSTMAGEYSFSIALTLAVLGLGLLAQRTPHRQVSGCGPPCADLARDGLARHRLDLRGVRRRDHLFGVDRQDPHRLTPSPPGSPRCCCHWRGGSGPFLFGHEFMTDMKYGFRPSGTEDSFWDMYFPLTPALDIIITTLAVIGFASFVLKRHLTGTAIGLICLLFVAGVYFTRESLPVIGLLWNPRLLPFVYLTRYMLMVAGGYELVPVAQRHGSRTPRGTRTSRP